MSYIDLVTAAQDAVIAALAPIATANGMPAGLLVCQHVPQDTQPPWIRIGQVSAECQTQHAEEQLELLTVEVQCVWRGEERRTLLKMMHAVRAALHNQPISATGAAFTLPDFIKAEAGDAIADGVTYVGLSTFQFHAAPA